MDKEQILASYFELYASSFLPFLSFFFFSSPKVKKGKQRFNMKPKDGIKYLIGIGHLKDTPESIAHFLFTSDGLEKEQVFKEGKEKEKRQIIFVPFTYLSKHQLIYPLRLESTWAEDTN